MKTGNLIGLLAAALIALPLATCAAKAPVVGFIIVDADKYFAEEQRYNPFAKRVLEPNGFGFGLAEWMQFWGDQANENATLDLLRKFNVMVVDTPFDNSFTEIGPAKQRSAAAARKALEQYLQEGGSALLILQAVRYPGDKDQDYANLMIEGLGVQMLHEGVFDSKRSFKSPIASIFPPEGFCWTENVTKGHPVTEGVSRLCLPQYHNGNTPGVVGMKVSPEWQVLVRGEESAQSYVVTREHVTDYNQVGTYKSAPPIVAVRAFGKGRVMAFSVPARSVSTNYGVAGWNMIVETAGNAEAKLPSDGGRMTLNALKWLAETSRDNPDLGTFKTDPVGRVQFPKSIEFDKYEFPAPAKGVRGILGAKTALSDGAGSVEEYVASSKAAGLSFIVFNESLEKMAAEKLEQLKAECKRLSTDSFYACPGVEFTDDLGNRWAIWGERVIFPQGKFKRAYGETTAERPELVQWDGQVLHNPGQYWEYCAYTPNMLLTYRNLRAKNAHPANMWWFYRLPPYVYDRGKLVEDQFSEWLYALRDIRHITPASYTRIYAPSEVAAAAATSATGGRDLASMRDWLNTRCGSFGHHAVPYVTGGPVIEQWAAINSQHDVPFDVRGKQRARLRFHVSSADGIREVKVHNCDYGVVRRFLANGQTAFAQEFELAHDRDHTLTLEVTDMKGRKAVSEKIYLFSYKMSLFRCGDNLNFLGGVGLCWHPDRNEMLNLGQMYQGTPVESIGGYDSAAALTKQAVLRMNAIDHINTQELKEYPLPWEQGIMRKILDVKLPGNDVKICDMDMGPLVERYDSLTRDTPARTSVPAVVAENQLFSRTHRAYYLQNRTNMYIAWDYRRAREGSENYRGGMVWHEGKITFKRDATLAGSMPIMLFYFTGGAADGTPTTVFIKDAAGGPVASVLPKGGQPSYKQGAIAPGGYVTAGPCDVYSVFYAASDTNFRYALVSDPATGRINQLQVGLGQNGQKVTAGTEITYRFGVATLGGPLLTTEQSIAKFEDLGDSFGIGDTARRGVDDHGVRAACTTGKLVSREMFLTVQADRNEAQFRVEPRETIVDLPIRVQGIEDNGCAAVYSTARPWFRWVGVAEGSAWFQESVDKGSEIWAGNVFVCDNKEVKLTLVRDGIAEGRQTFLEVHNPTDKAIKATITSPEHAPLYGGTRLIVDAPAGTSVTVPVKPVR